MRSPTLTRRLGIVTRRPFTLSMTVVLRIAARRRCRARTSPRCAERASSRRSSKRDHVGAGVTLEPACFPRRCRGSAAPTCWRNSPWSLRLGAQLHAGSPRACLCGAGHARPGPYSRLLMGDFGRPQIFWPSRRSILYFASWRLVIRVLADHCVRA